MTSRASLWIVTVALFAAACTLVAATRVARSADLQTLEVDGEERSYLLRVPDSAKHQDRPLVLVFHGGGGRAQGIERVTGMNAVADKHGFVVCYPDAGDGVWGTLRSTTGDPAADVAFIEALIAHLVAEHDVDAGLRHRSQQRR